MACLCWRSPTQVERIPQTTKTATAFYDRQNQTYTFSNGYITDTITANLERLLFPKDPQKTHLPIQKIALDRITFSPQDETPFFTLLGKALSLESLSFKEMDVTKSQLQNIPHNVTKVSFLQNAHLPDNALPTLAKHEQLTFLFFKNLKTDHIELFHAFIKQYSRNRNFVVYLDTVRCTLQKIYAVAEVIHDMERIAQKM